MLILGINFCPCKNSLIETLFCTYYVRNKSSKLYTKRISAGLLIRVKCKYVESKSNQHLECGWLVSCGGRWLNHFRQIFNGFSFRSFFLPSEAYSYVRKYILSWAYQVGIYVYTHTYAYIWNHIAALIWNCPVAFQSHHQCQQQHMFLFALRGLLICT